MREVFRNNIGQQLIITDEGIHHSDKEKSTIIPRDQITRPLKLTIGVLGISTSWKTAYTFVPEGKEDKNRLKAVFDTFNSLIGKPISKELTDEDFGFEPLKPVEIIPDSKEFRMHCKVCGHVYCYTMGEYKENERLKKEVDTKELTGALSTLFTSRSLGSSQNQEAEMMKMRIKDFSRCPRCNSADIHELAEGEMPPAAQTSAPSAASPMDELKKAERTAGHGYCHPGRIRRKEEAVPWSVNRCPCSPSTGKQGRSSSPRTVAPASPPLRKKRIQRRCVE